MTLELLEEDFDEMDEICAPILNLPDVEYLINITTSISAPLK